MRKSNLEDCLRSTRTTSKRLRFAALLLVTSVAVVTYAQPSAAPAKPSPSKPLRVCADPDNLPQSDKSGAGYENKLAQALARDLGKPLEYTFFPQRMGFVRNTLKQRDEKTGDFKCDLILGVPIGFDPAATTSAYMRSTWALVVPTRAKLGALSEPNELLKLPKERLQQLRFGVFSRSPGTDWLLKNGLVDRAKFYSPQSGDVSEHPASIVERDLSDGSIDVAIVWGPVAGFLAKRHTGNDGWNAVPFRPDAEIRFDYEIAMGVRQGDKDWKTTVDHWIAAHHPEIDTILDSYQVPLLELTTETKKEMRHE
jgi:quinoprotein dehydrogenase-associated probable ABC transporter substrate-binding protein